MCTIEMINIGSSNQLLYLILHRLAVVYLRKSSSFITGPLKTEFTGIASYYYLKLIDRRTAKQAYVMAAAKYRHDLLEAADELAEDDDDTIV